LCAAVLLAVVLLLARAGAQTNNAGSRPPGAELFADKTVRTFKIEIVGDELEALKKDNRRYVRATVREGKNSFTNVAVHLKGMGSFRPLQEKPSFAVRFDKFNPNQTYCGLSKLMLNNSSQDSTYLAEYISYELVPRCRFACRACHPRLCATERARSWSLCAH
jgi:hypothetical protein